MVLSWYVPRCSCEPGAWRDPAAARSWFLFSKTPTTRCRPNVVRSQICWTGEHRSIIVVEEGSLKLRNLASVQLLLAARHYAECHSAPATAATPKTAARRP